MQNRSLRTDMYLQNTEKSNTMLYRDFAPKMYGICLRFAGNKMEADDILQEAFIKIFTKIKHFRNEGSLEGWIRRTIINTAINFYRRSAKHNRMLNINDLEISSHIEPTLYNAMSQVEILRLVQELPNGYRTVFNLNVIEGYTHKEIGEMLGISDNTSKSQLTRARIILKRRVLQMMARKQIAPIENNLRITKKDKEVPATEIQYALAV